MYNKVNNNKSDTKPINKKSKMFFYVSNNVFKWDYVYFEKLVRVLCLKRWGFESKFTVCCEAKVPLFS
jgi:hypothetical protein